MLVSMRFSSRRSMPANLFGPEQHSCIFVCFILLLAFYLFILKEKIFCHVKHFCSIDTTDRTTSQYSSIPFQSSLGSSVLCSSHGSLPSQSQRCCLVQPHQIQRGITTFWGDNVSASEGGTHSPVCILSRMQGRRRAGAKQRLGVVPKARRLLNAKARSCTPVPGLQVTFRPGHVVVQCRGTRLQSNPSPPFLLSLSLELLETIKENKRCLQG